MIILCFVFCVFSPVFRGLHLRTGSRRDEHRDNQKHPVQGVSGSLLHVLQGYRRHHCRYYVRNFGCEFCKIVYLNAICLCIRFVKGMRYLKYYFFKHLGWPYAKKNISRTPSSKYDFIEYLISGHKCSLHIAILSNLLNLGLIFFFPPQYYGLVYAKF